MKYCCPQCGVCNTKNKENSCVDVALEFALDNGEKVIVRLGSWHGDLESEPSYLASVLCRRKDGSLFLLAAVPRYVLDSNGKAPVKGKTFEEVDMVLSLDTQAICERVFCCGQTYFSKTTVNALKHHYEEEERSRLFGYGYRARKRQIKADIERYCYPDGCQVVDCLTEEHLRRIRYFGKEDWE